MIQRYTRPEMGRIWSDENKYAQWLAVELANCDVQAERGQRCGGRGLGLALLAPGVRQVRQRVARQHQLDQARVPGERSRHAARQPVVG